MLLLHREYDSIQSPRNPACGRNHEMSSVGCLVSVVQQATKRNGLGYRSRELLLRHV
jgi:hypothetical protein